MGLKFRINSKMALEIVNPLYYKNKAYIMKPIWYIIYIILLNAFLIGTSILWGFTKEGIQALLPNYITVSTAILAVTFAAIAIKEKILQEERPLIGIIVITSIIGIFASIFALYFSYYKADFFLFGATIIFYGATISISSSIFAMAAMASKIISPNENL